MKYINKPVLEVDHKDVDQAKKTYVSIRDLINIVDCDESCHDCPFFNEGSCLFRKLDAYGYAIWKNMQNLQRG